MPSAIENKVNDVEVVFVDLFPEEKKVKDKNKNEFG